MRKKLVNFVLENGLSPFDSIKKSVHSDKNTIFITKDAKKIHSKVLGKLSSEFLFNESSNLWNCFGIRNDFTEIKKKTGIFRKFKK